MQISLSIFITLCLLWFWYSDVVCFFQVVLSGNWKFSSALHIPIDLRVGVTNEDGSYMQYGDVRTLHPGGQLPSILAPDGAVEGINLRITTTVHWSVTYPLPAGGVGWNKPNMLMEVGLLVWRPGHDKYTC